MFPDSAIAEKFSLQKDKCLYDINFGLAPYYQSILVKDIYRSDFYAVSFDESLNPVIQMGQMDLVVNYWDSVVNCVCTNYLDSTFLGHSRSRGLLHNFLLVLKSLNKTKLIQVSMDGPNANWAFYSELDNYRDENNINTTDSNWIVWSPFHSSIIQSRGKQKRKEN